MSSSLNDSGSIDPYLDCSQYSLPDVSLAYWIYIGITIAVNLLLISLWFIKRELFPLKERSPYLVITSLIGNLLVQTSFPATFIFEKTFNGSYPAAEYVLWGFLPFGGVCLFMPFLWRAARLEHAFNWAVQSKFRDFLFSRQSVAVLLTCACALAYAVITLTTLNESSLQFYTGDKPKLASHFGALAFMDFMKMGFLIVAIFALRFVKREYNFKNEIIISIFLLFVSFNMTFALSVFGPQQRNDPSQGCSLIGYSTVMLISNIRNWLIIAITAAYPLFVTTRVHYLLSQEFVINIFHNILGDETCIEAFDEYIRSGRKKNDTLLYASAYEANDEAELFRVFMSLRKRIMQGETSLKIVDKMMDEYVNNEKVADFFPPAYIYDLKREYRERRENMTIESFDRLHGFCIYYFQDVFENRFKKTRSFEYIRDLFKTNEKINRKLHTLKLVSIS